MALAAEDGEGEVLDEGVPQEVGSEAEAAEAGDTGVNVLASTQRFLRPALNQKKNRILDIESWYPSMFPHNLEGKERQGSISKKRLIHFFIVPNSL